LSVLVLIPFQYIESNRSDSSLGRKSDDYILDTDIETLRQGQTDPLAH